MVSDDYPQAYETRILFVDDNPALLRSLDRLLRMEGFQVWLAEDGEVALRQLEQATVPPDLIISDIAMPRMDGFQLFEAVRAREEWLDIPFVFLTARDQIEDLRRGYSLGADDYLVKPLDQERLLMIIRSKLKRRAELLGRIQVQQDALNDAKRDLAFLIAHELRTPLVSISMVTDILSAEVGQMDSAQIEDMLSIMRSGSLRLTRLVEQMVMYVQLESGALASAITMVKRPHRADELVKGGVDRGHQLALRPKGQAVEVSGASAEAFVRGDLKALQHALAELVVNALVYSPQGDLPHVRVQRDDDHLAVSVIDHGSGIPAEELAHVCDPYFQVGRHQTEQQGIGLGLTIAKGIVEAHGGWLELESTEGVGTRATVHLPVVSSA